MVIGMLQSAGLEQATGGQSCNDRVAIAIDKMPDAI
jgi:hypothetical protein